MNQFKSADLFHAGSSRCWMCSLTFSCLVLPLPFPSSSSPKLSGKLRSSPLPLFVERKEKEGILSSLWKREEENETRSNLFSSADSPFLRASPSVGISKEPLHPGSRTVLESIPRRRFVFPSFFFFLSFRSLSLLLSHLFNHSLLSSTVVPNPTPRA